MYGIFFIYLKKIVDFYGELVGKFTSPMDPSWVMVNSHLFYQPTEPNPSQQSPIKKVLSPSMRATKKTLLLSMNHPGCLMTGSLFHGL